MANVAVNANANGSGITRREFLYYIWGASMALYTAQAAGLLVWYLIPRFREGEFGGTFTLPIEVLPEVNGQPYNYPDGRFWLVNLDTNNAQGKERMWKSEDESNDIKGVAAIYKVCTHLGCIYAWTPSNNRFECPCHGSKYRLDGRRIESPAPRSLDRFKLEALAEDKSTVLAEAVLEGDFYSPVELPADTRFVRVDTGEKKQGPSLTLLCDFSGSCP